MDSCKKKYQIEWKVSALKELKKIPKQNLKRILKCIKALSSSPYPSGCRKLAGTQNTYRVRIGNYRVIYQRFDDRLIIEIIQVGHRKNIYQKAKF